MIKNIQSLMDKSKNFAKEKGLSVQEVLQNYMFERFLERLSKSEYNEKFIIKGRIFIIFYAEKLETVLKRNTANSRMKDYYDLFYFATYKWNDIDVATLKSAIDTTFRHRNSQEYLEKLNTIISNILEDKSLIVRWDKYRKEHEYAKDIKFEDTIRAIEKIYNVL